MRTIIIILTIVLVSCQINVGYNNNKRLDDFKIMCIGYFRNIELVKQTEPSILIEQIDGKLLFYEYELIKEEPIHIAPLKNAEGKQKIISMSDTEYINKLSMLFSYNTAFGIIGNQDKIYLAVAFKSELKDGEKSIRWKGKCFTKDESENSQINYYYSKDTISLGSVSYFDSDYNYHLLENASNKYETKILKAINPDIDITNRYEFIPYEELIKMKSGIYFHGFAEISLDKKTICYNGKEFPLYLNIEMHGNNEYACSISAFLELFQGTLVGDSFKGNYEAYRLYGQCSNKPNIIKLEFKIGDYYARVNGKSYKLIFEPYDKNEGEIVYLPLKDLCKIFRSAHHYRALNNTILIPLFVDPSLVCE